MSGYKHNSKDAKLNQLNQQELMLAKKIEEIKAKNEAGKKKCDETSSSSSSLGSDKPEKAAFSSDGNFMNNYLNMKQGNTEAGVKREATPKGKGLPNKKSRFSSMFQQMKKTQAKAVKVEAPTAVTATCFHNDDSSSDEEKNEKAKSSQPSKPKSAAKPSALITSPTNVQYKIQAAAAKINNAVATNSKVTPAKAKPRKNRWGEKIDLAEIAPVGMANIAGVPNIPIPQVVIPQPLTADQKKQLEEQREMQAMYSLVMANRTQQQLAAQKQMKVQHEYDSDEEIDDAGGTWEHVKRRQEMEKTQALAEKLTDEATGKHFIGDFLPPAELAKFMETFKALKEGRTPDYSDYKDFKIQCDNVGFKMLQKMGWDEGQGLGNEGQGIVQPVNQGQKSIDGRGLGVEKPAELSKDDDNFSAYRKRMMLAYRFRPNPLNNPRRSYY